MPRAVVLVIDGLGARQLGPYGNTWIATPAFNRLASQSLLMQNTYTQPTLGKAYRDLWLVPPFHGAIDLISRLNATGITTTLLTDVADITDLPMASFFAEQQEMATPSGLQLAANWSETHTAQFFAQAVAVLTDLPPDTLTWLHTAGLGNPWDAPFSFRAQFADDEDPEPSGSAQVPSLTLDEGFDPDALHEIRCAFAGQVTLIDRCLLGLLAVVEEMSDQHETLFVVTGSRSFPLGEHHIVGWNEARLYAELLHVPVFLRFPRQQHAMQRLTGLGEIADVARMIDTWFASQPLPPITRDFSICQNEDEFLLRTPVWHHRFPALSAEPSANSELYVKPDDQHEVNDVSDRCPPIVAAGREFVLGWLGSRGQVPKLPDVLLQRPD